MDRLKDSLRLWTMHRGRRAVFAELDSYTDRALADIDTGRADVARTAHAGAVAMEVRLALRRRDRRPIFDPPANLGGL